MEINKKLEIKTWNFKETFHVGIKIYNPEVSFFPFITVHDIHTARKMADNFISPQNPGMEIWIVDKNEIIVEVRKDGKIINE